jgi:hypothetical protein
MDLDIKKFKPFMQPLQPAAFLFLRIPPHRRLPGACSIDAPFNASLDAKCENERRTADICREILTDAVMEKVKQLTEKQ